MLQIRSCLVSGALAAGCVLISAGPVARPARAGAVPIPAGIAPDSVLAGPLDAPAPAAALLTLNDALGLALRHSPRLAASAWGIRAAAGRALDAGRRPNPALEGSVEDWGGSLGPERTETTLALAQTFELGGDRGARAALADAERRLAGAEFDADARDLAGDVVEEFLSAWLAQERMWRRREAVAIAGEAVRSAAERHRAGAAPAVERVRAEADLALLEAGLSRATAEWGIARRALAMRWGDSRAAIDSLVLPAPDAAASDTAAFREVAPAAEHPWVARESAGAEVAESRVRLAHAERVPDLDVRFGARRIEEAGGTGLVTGVSLPIPIWNRSQGTALAAEAGRAAALARRTEAERRREREAGAQRERLSAAGAAYSTLAERALPAADEALESLRQAYRAGRLGYLDLLAGQRAALETRLLTAEAAREVWSARLALELMTAGAAANETGGAR